MGGVRFVLARPFEINDTCRLGLPPNRSLIIFPYSLEISSLVLLPHLLFLETRALNIYEYQSLE